MNGKLLAALFLGSSFLPASELAPTGAPESRDYETRADETRDTYELDAVGNGVEPSPSSSSSEPQDRYFRASGLTCRLHAPEPGEPTSEFVAQGCSDDEANVIRAEDCAAGTVQLGDLWVERVAADGSYGEAELVEPGACITPGDVAAEAQRAFAQLQVTAPEATIQAARPLLVNVHYPVQANAEPVEQQFTLLDVPVLIRAEPVEYTWDFDDPHKPGGGTLTTTETGGRWHDGMDRPDETWVGHTYTHLGDPETDPGTLVDAEGDWYREAVTITLTTTWQGSYQLVGTSTWTDINGTLTTTSTLEPLTVTEARVRLVCTDLNGDHTC